MSLAFALACGSCLSFVGAWFNGTELVPRWSGIGAPSKITTSWPFHVTPGQPLLIGPGLPEPVVVVEVIDATQFVVARSRRAGWQLRRRVISGWRI